MLAIIRQKIRALVEDAPAKSDIETFTYTNSTIFTITSCNVVGISKVLRNGAELGSGEFDFDATTNKLEIILASGSEFAEEDIIEVDFVFNKYSDAEIDEFLRASLVWISIFSGEGTTDYELEDEDIYPTPDNKSTDLMALVASILIKPNYSRYSLPNVTVVYPKTMDKDEKIKKLIMNFNAGLGCNGIIEFD